MEVIKRHHRFRYNHQTSTKNRQLLVYRIKMTTSVTWKPLMTNRLPYSTHLKSHLSITTDTWTSLHLKTIWSHLRKYIMIRRRAHLNKKTKTSRKVEWLDHLNRFLVASMLVVWGKLNWPIPRRTITTKTKPHQNLPSNNTLCKSKTSSKRHPLPDMAMTHHLCIKTNPQKRCSSIQALWCRE